MSLATFEKTVVNDIKDGVQNAVNWLTQVTEQHLPAAIDELKRLQSSPVTKAVEAALLTPAEEEWLSALIARIPELRAGSRPQPEAPAGDVPAEPEPQPAA